MKRGPDWCTIIPYIFGWDHTGIWLYCKPLRLYIELSWNLTLYWYKQPYINLISNKKRKKS